MFKEKLRVRLSQLTDVAIIAFLVSLTVSITSPVFPIFAEKISGSPESVGLVVSVFGASAIIINLSITRFFEKEKALKNLRFGLLLFPLVYALYLFAASPLMLALLQVVLAAAVCFSWTALSLLVNSSSRKENLGDSEGEYFTFINFGTLLGILAGGILAMSYSYDAVFLLAAIIFFGIYVLSGAIGINDRNKPHKCATGVMEDARRFFRNAELKRAYISNVGLYFWVSIAFLYLPIILKSLGFNFREIGIVFAAMIVPYLLLEYPVGKLAEKHGSHRFISIGFFAIALASLLIYLNFGAIYAMAGFFFISFMGAAAIEPLNEMELDRHSGKSDIVENMSVFKTSLRLAYFLGPISAAALIEFFGMKGMFLAVSLIMAAVWWVVGE